MEAGTTAPKADFRDLWNGFRRRRRAVLSCTAIGITVTMLLALFVPAVYRSSGTILIEQQELPADLVRSTVSSYADQRVQVISQRVMTTETLLKVINRFDLYSAKRARETREELIARMRDDIDFRMISADVIDPRSGRPTAATIAFEVSYTNRDPEAAARVANELTSLYLNENLTQRTRLAQDASEFLRAEGDRISERISTLEKQLADFKAKNAGTLPEMQQFNLELLDRTEQQSTNLETQRASLDQQRVFLEAQLAQLKPHSVMYSESGERIMTSADRLKVLRSQLASAEALYSAGHPDIARLKREIAGLEQPGSELVDQNDLVRRLEQSRAELAAASERYGPEHPDRLRLEREIASLQGRMVAPAPAPTEFKPVSGDNPAFVQIQAQLSANINDRRALDSQLAKLRAEMSEYRRKISVSPEVERDYRELTRDYENERAKYQDIRAKQMEAQTAQNLETDRKGERFTLIEPPMVPEKPVSPNRGVLLILGTLLSVLAAVGLVWLLERMDTTVRGRSDLRRLLGVPPLAVVPRIITATERRAARWNFRIAAVTSSMLGVAMLLSSAHIFVRPLDSIWYAVLRKLGI